MKGARGGNRGQDRARVEGMIAHREEFSLALARLEGEALLALCLEPEKEGAAEEVLEMVERARWPR